MVTGRSRDLAGDGDHITRRLRQHAGEVEDDQAGPRMVSAHDQRQEYRLIFRMEGQMPDLHPMCEQ